MIGGGWLSERFWNELGFVGGEEQELKGRNIFNRYIHTHSVYQREEEDEGEEEGEGEEGRKTVGWRVKIRHQELGARKTTSQVT